MQLLYHYCSTETFVSIVTNRTIRLSSLTLSNDSQEGLVILDVLLQLAKDAGLDKLDLAVFEKHLQLGYELFDGLGFCLSEEGDLLSQWRGYADDGRGICIGFTKPYLEKLGSSAKNGGGRNFSLKQLVYDKTRQREVAERNFRSIRELIREGAFRSSLGSLLLQNDDAEKEKIARATGLAGIGITIAMLDMFDIKNPAFSEEKEWRLISFTTKGNLKEPEIRFRGNGDKIVPYSEVKLENLDAEPIGRVVLGPKHQTPMHVIEQILSSSGFKAVEVTRSIATYR